MFTSYSRAQWLPVTSLTSDLITTEYLITTVQHLDKDRLNMLVAKKCIFSEDTLIVNSAIIGDSIMHELLRRLHAFRKSPLCFCVTKMIVSRGMVSTIATHPEWFSMSDKNENVLHLIAKSGSDFWADIFTEMVEKKDSLGRCPLFYVLMHNLPQQTELKNKLIRHTTIPDKELLALMIKHDMYQFINMKNIDLIDVEEMAAFQAIRCCNVYLKFAGVKRLSDIVANRIAVLGFLSGDELFGLTTMRKTYQDYVPQSIKELIYKKVSAKTSAEINRISSPDRMNDDYVSADEKPTNLRGMAPPNRKSGNTFNSIRSSSSGSTGSITSDRFVTRGHHFRPIPNVPVRSESSSSERDSELFQSAKNRMALKEMQIENTPTNRVISLKSRNSTFNAVRSPRSASSDSTSSTDFMNRVNNTYNINFNNDFKSHGLMRNSRLTQIDYSQNSDNTNSVSSNKSVGSNIFSTIKPLCNAASGATNASNLQSRSKPLRFGLSPEHTERQKVIESIIAQSKEPTSCPSKTQRAANTARPAVSSATSAANFDPYSNQTNMNLRSRSADSDTSMRRYNSVASNNSN